MPTNRISNQQEELSALHAALKTVIADGRRADQTVGLLLREHRRWSGTHKRDWVTSVYGILANWRRLWFIMGSEPRDQWNIASTRQLKEIWLILRTGTVGESGAISKEEKALAKRIKQSAGDIGLRDSWPDWLNQVCQDCYGKEWNSLSHALHQPAPTFLRCNTLKCDKDSLIQRLSEENHAAQPVTDTEHTLLSVGSPTEILHTQAYRAGLFEVQDLHSQMISPATLAGPGQTVVDLCAGEGGKTLHLACLMQNKGRLFASDTAEWKLDRLRLRARRAGISNLQIVPASESKRWKRMAGQCDAVLVDAPCSGLGSLRRHVDIKWHLTPQQLDQLCMEQDTLLEQAIPLLKPSGVIVYATCSILPIEGEQRIQQFCQKFTDFECQWQQRFHPADHKGDGFYAARLRRRNRTTDNTTSPA